MSVQGKKEDRESRTEELEEDAKRHERDPDFCLVSC